MCGGLICYAGGMDHMGDNASLMDQ